MTQAISFQTEYTGRIGEEEIALMYRAFAEDNQPYVVALHLPDGGILTFVQSAEFMCEEGQRRNATEWVETLTKLVAKARDYDELVDALFDEEGETEAAPVDLDEPSDHLDSDNDAFVVDRLGDEETDAEWVDQDDDHYKHIDGEWHVSYNGDEPWRPVHVEGPEFLTEYGPYRAVGPA